LWVLAALLRALSWVGIKIDLLVIVREGETPIDTSHSPDEYDYSFVSATDVEELYQLDPESDRKKLATLFQDGKVCFGIRDNGRLIAKMWCDLDEFYHPTHPHKLAADEAYLFLAYVDPDYRGQGLAPKMRAAGYAALREMGRSKFFSYSRYFNSAARRFKTKLGAREEGLRMHIRLFGKWSRSLTFRWHSNSGP
jgi:RimJ/RimL family protein N-acetyltransferase